MNTTTADSLLRIVDAISQRERKLSKQSFSTPLHQQTKRLQYLLVGVPLIIALLVGAIAYFFENYQWLVQVSLASLLITYAGVLFHPLISLIIHRESALRTLKNPFTILTDNTRLSITTDSHYITNLKRRSRQHLEHLLMEIRAEKESFENRLGLLIGAIEKVGIFPGFISVIAIILKFQNTSSDWLYAIAYAFPVLYIFGLIFHMLLKRYERIAQLIELVLKWKSEEENRAMTHIQSRRFARNMMSQQP